MIWGRIQVRNHCLSHCPPLSPVRLPFKAFSLLIPVTFCRIAKRVLPKHILLAETLFALYLEFRGGFLGLSVYEQLWILWKWRNWFTDSIEPRLQPKLQNLCVILLVSQTSQRKHLEILIVIISYSSFLKAMRYFLCCTLLIIMHRSAGLAYSSFAVPLRPTRWRT